MKQILFELQKKRNFDADDYLQRKTRLINEFFSLNQLNAAVVGLSGGIDSAVALMILKKAASENNSPIKKIIAVILPIVGDGTSGQVEATSNSISLVRSHGIDSNLVDLSDAYNDILKKTNPSIIHHDKIISSDHHANSKLAATLRIASLYHHREILEGIGFRTSVIGTINRDEGSYIGYFKKSSDAVADIQLIADLHKSELIQLGYHLGVTPNILDQESRTNYDNRTDEEIIGVPYWFIEMYMLIKDFNYENKKLFDKIEYQKYSKILEDLHKKNKHKYSIPIYCHFLDVMQRKVEGGW